jgi:hypothetical protein
MEMIKDGDDKGTAKIANICTCKICRTSLSRLDFLQTDSAVPKPNHQR